MAQQRSEADIAAENSRLAVEKAWNEPESGAWRVVRGWTTA